MSERNFREMLEFRWSVGHFLCVGLDSEYARIPEASKRQKDGYGSFLGAGVCAEVITFNQAMIDVTKRWVCAYKLNRAFYNTDALWCALRETIVYIKKVAPNVPVILDAKYGDTYHTNEQYAEEAFDWFQADAVTVNPLPGREALQPFLDQKDKGVIVLCRTSNPGAGEFQDLPVKVNNEEANIVSSGWWAVCDYKTPLYKHIAYRVSCEWSKNGNCALVVGAMYPDELREIRKIVGGMPILIPGIGAQQKDVPLEKQVERVVAAGKDNRGRGMIINASRIIIFASQGEDFAEAAGREAEKLNRLINQFLEK